MSWRIQWDGCPVGYTYREEGFNINYIESKNTDIKEEPGSGYKAPNDVIMEEIYAAKTEHGDFEWLVTARSSGFNPDTIIEDVQLLKKPQHCESQLPRFKISE